MPERPSSPRNLFDEAIFRLLVDYEARRSQRYVNPVSLLRIALTHRSREEREAGASSALAFLLNTRLRASDIAGRIGENEYAVLLPNTNQAGARAVCGRLLDITSRTQPAPGSRAVRLFLCIGISCHPGGMDLNPASLLQEAESALQESRLLGPQTYVLYARRPPPSPAANLELN